MNSVNLIGRLTADPELRQMNGGISVCSFSVAVDRRFKSAQGERETDFINCQAWKHTAEFLAKYFKKGSRVGVSGSLQVRSWQDKQGGNRYATEVNVEQVYFADGKEGGQKSSFRSDSRGSADAVEEDIETSLPFDL